MDLKAWIEIWLTAVIGATAALVAWRQFRLERKRDDHELWDRRLVACDAGYRFLDAVSQSGTPGEPQFTELMNATESPRLEILFDDGAAPRLIKIRERGPRALDDCSAGAQHAGGSSTGSVCGEAARDRGLDGTAAAAVQEVDSVQIQAEEVGS